MPCNKRYSNYEPGEFVGPPMEDGSYVLNTGNSTSGSGWSAQNTVDVVNTGAGLIQTVLTSIFGRNNVQQAQYTNQLYQNERRTNTILWVIIGLVLALGVVLVIRKTK